MKSDDTRKLDEILLDLDTYRITAGEATHADYDREKRLNEYIKGQ